MAVAVGRGDGVAVSVGTAEAVAVEVGTGMMAIPQAGKKKAARTVVKIEMIFLVPRVIGEFSTIR
jgi:hypothetical protein